MNVNKQTAKLYLQLCGRMSERLIYKEVFGMTEEEAEKAWVNYLEERARVDSRVEAVYIQHARNKARRALGFREKNDDVKPMPTSGLAQLMGFGPTVSSEPEQEEEEL